jgi:uncharacterized repeat protein (TIGR03803 family)
MSRITPTLSFLCVMITLGFLTLAPSAHAAGEKVIHSFNGSGNLPFSPMGGVIFDSAGNLYGTTVGGGARNDGAVFELTLGEWQMDGCARLQSRPAARWRGARCWPDL